MDLYPKVLAGKWGCVIAACFALSLAACAEHTTHPNTVNTATKTAEKIPAVITDGRLFTLEGKTPHPLIDDQTLRFAALEAQYLSPNGNGLRHEYKIKSSLRTAMSKTYELFKADIKVEMSDGGKTIVAQHHTGGLGTIMKLYVSDTSEQGLLDGVANNGVFDVYVRLRSTVGMEEKNPFGTIQSGEEFDLRVVNNYGEVWVYAMGEAFGIPVKDDSAAYFKFGNYLQSQSPVTLKKCGVRGNAESFLACYAEYGITESVISMTNVEYQRKR
ncbi:polysaccharide lyase family 7 protein [Gilvimarinus sp. 1_MG-2023]|uniref:polysaccharide lyase family 7 protein n=1 Tax=Gilvimarinus sp. 1_MG-2023 TaxID=3062638 RepID=UPI0026E2128D|nr:polysaccharide lyase family 7 protein [Gilvimarinus sp. 1_MG-2023]MDO6746606.1 polysaccharide lyase family 7 protein [Gilvimarinus sp. 1_MG-2023]